MRYRILVAALLLVVSLPLAAPAQVAADTRLAHAAGRSVVTYPKYTVFDDVNVTVDAGVVTLSGKVTLAGKKEDIGRRVEQLQGVTSVRNEIDVIPPSAEDDGLRRRVARAIYGSASFWKYASLQSPPIRILVESGHVTLKGSVEREHDRTVAQSLATGHGEASITNELRVVGTARLPD